MTLGEAAAYLDKLEARRAAQKEAAKRKRHAALGLSLARLRVKAELSSQRPRFERATDLAPLAPAWARDFVAIAFPGDDDEQRMLLMLAAEAGFMAVIALGKGGLRVWAKTLPVSSQLNAYGGGPSVSGESSQNRTDRKAELLMRLKRLNRRGDL